MGCTIGKHKQQKSKQQHIQQERPQKDTRIEVAAQQANAQSKLNQSNHDFPINGEKIILENQVQIINQSKVIIPCSNSLSKNALKFNDIDLLQKKTGEFQKIHAIKVIYNEEKVEGIQVAYEMSNGNIVSGTNNYVKSQSKNNHKKSDISNNSMSTNNNREDVFEIPIDDYLIEISGRASQSLNSIRFKTYKGEKSQIFGSNELGKPFSFKIDGHTFGPFSGFISQNSAIQTLEIPIYPIPIDFYEQIKN